jgi:ATP-dependent 26S proteasome regulatory subunit
MEKVEDGLDYIRLSNLTDGFSGSDLREICRTASVYRMRELVNRIFCYARFFVAVIRETSGTDVVILKIFSPKKMRKNWRFLLKTKLNYGIILS